SSRKRRCWSAAWNWCARTTRGAWHSIAKDLPPSRAPPAGASPCTAPIARRTPRCWRSTAPWRSRGGGSFRFDDDAFVDPPPHPPPQGGTGKPMLVPSPLEGEGQGGG